MSDIPQYCYRLRQVDVKAEHFERQVQRAEQERDAWEKKYEVRLFTINHTVASLTPFQESEAKYKKSQQDLEELEKSMQDL
jgi:tropomyosin